MGEELGFVVEWMDFDNFVFFLVFEVVAFDGAESALTPPAANENRKSFQIEVADVNDNPPYFPQVRPPT